MKILIATSNAGKLSEMQEFLGEIPGIEFLSLKDFSENFGEPEEDGSTFAENAEKKAKYFFEKTAIPTIAEDSGVFIEALKGELGVKTRRWGAGENASDEEWMEFFLNRMKDEANRSAEFFTASCFFDGENSEIFEGSCPGIVVQESTAPLKKGIPLSSYFIPSGKTKVFSEMTKKEKSEISHRGNAMKRVKQFLEKIS